jgi:hypothetical protein
MNQVAIILKFFCAPLDKGGLICDLCQTKMLNHTKYEMVDKYRHRQSTTEDCINNMYLMANKSSYSIIY